MKKTAQKNAAQKTEAAQTAAPQTDPMKNLKRIVANYDNCRMEAARHTQLLNEAEAEEKRLIEESDPTNDEHLRKISDLKIRREMLSKKVAQFKVTAEEDMYDLGHECNKLIDDLKKDLDKKWSDTVLLIARALRGFFYERYEDSIQAAKEVVENTNFGTQYHQLYPELRSDGLLDKLPIFKAKAILDLFQKIDYLAPVTGLHGRVFGHPKTSEMLEDEELARLLTADGREERILSMMSQTGGIMTREVAEKSVDGRIARLQDEQEGGGLPSDNERKKQKHNNENENGKVSTA